MSLAIKARAGVKWTTASAIAGAASQLLLTAVLAHFLEKKDFGLMAIALFVINFSQLFIDIGISNAIIHKQTVTHNQLSSLYWCNIIIGFFLFGLLFTLAPLISGFYKEPLLKNIIRWVGLTFLIQPFGMQFSTLLRKELHFKELAIRNIISRTIGLVIGALLGFYGYGIYALVYSTIAMAFLDMLLLVILGRKIHSPSLHFRLTEIKPFFSFGMYQMGEKMINYINSDIDTLIIGKFLGIETLGIYNIAKNFVLKPFQVINPILTRVAFPVMAKVQNDIPKLKSIYLKMQSVLAFINFPVFIFMFFYAEAVILLIFGSRWLDAAMPLRILSLYAMIRSTMNPIGSLQLARGRADQGFYWNLVQSVILIVAVYLGSRGGILGVCYTLLGIQSILFIISWKVMVNPLCAADFIEFNAVFWEPLYLSFIPAVLLFPLLHFLFPAHNFSTAIVVLLLYLSLLAFIHIVIKKTFIVEVKRLLLNR
ncbi:MOP flippase family protein [Agriterribacter humi]|uniref:MOP flippase family protein n=1 Tax=Agriterribacter humi TaxID=1104781 RepID=UPI001264EB44|nr:MOP flippase family protein [Agriterribacter humi]